MNSRLKAMQVEQAYILHSRPYRNTSTIIDIFSHNAGRLSLLAKGARTPKSPYYSILQPFIPLHLTFSPRGELPMLFKAEPISTLSTLMGERIYNGLYLNELLMRLLHQHDPHPELYVIYARCLEQLATQQEQDVVLRYFELDLLELLGYAVNLTHDGEDGAMIHPQQQYQYLLERGPVLLKSANSSSLAISGEALLSLARRTLHATAERQQAKHLMRQILDHHLGKQPLKTRELYRHFRQ